MVPEMSATDMTRMAEAVERLIVLGADREYEAAGQIVVDVTTEWGHHGAWLLCCGIASGIKVLGRMASGPHAILTTHQGSVVAPEALPTEWRPQVWAARFMAAWCADESDTCLALFDATPERGPEHLAALIAMAGDVVREREAETQEGTDGD